MPDGKWLDISYSTWIGVLGLVVGAIGIILTIASWEEREVIYKVYDVRTTIFEKEEAGSKLTAVYDGEPVKEEISSVQLAVWNNGNRPVEKEDVLKQTQIVADTTVRILEVRVKQVSREVADFNAEIADSTGVVRLDWKILENEDGGVVQLIYAGSPGVGFSVEGTLKGQEQVISASRAALLPTAYNWYLVWALIASLPLLYFYYLNREKIREINEKTPRPITVVFSAFIGLSVYIASRTIVDYFNRIEIPF